METNKLNELTELFVRGKLHGDDLVAFNKQLEADPSLATEVTLQKNIKTAIVENRKAALKSRLNAIQVPSVTTGSTSVTSSFTALKAASVLLVCAGVSVGSYMYYNSVSSEKVADNQPVNSTESIVNESVAKTQESSVVANSELTKENKVVENVNSAANATNVENEESSTTVSANAELTKTKKRNFNLFKSKAKAETKQVPNLDALDDKSQANVTSHEDNPEALVTSNNIQKLSDVDIKTIQDGAHKFHYRMKDHVLYLYGEFNNTPYEILEFNDKDGNLLYFYYDNNYYSMKPNQEAITKLKKITDKKLISDLNVVRVR
ncbi:MAG: hypothetical protein SFY32_10780 [Bacteroidota bacterium]|nr:hypothetical protein [Bacteroidota bacterium]